MSKQIAVVPLADIARAGESVIGTKKMGEIIRANI